MDSQSIPTVSVIIPVYNVAQYVERCLLSVMQQTYPATECIIVDDASTDDSIARCERLISGYSGNTCFSILHHDRNRGLSASRNTGIDAATSVYIYFLDGDDELTSDCLEKLVAPVLQDDSIEMVWGNYRMDFTSMHGKKYRLSDCDSHYMEDTPQKLYNNADLRKWFFHGKISRSVTVWNRLLKISFVKYYHLYNKEGLLYDEDKLWTYHVMRHLNCAAFVHDVTYIHFFRPGSIVMGTTQKERAVLSSALYKEIAANIVLGERVEETEWVLQWFCGYYIDAADHPEYKYAYGIFRDQLSDGCHTKEIRQLKTVYYMAKNPVGRMLYKKNSKSKTFNKKRHKCFK